MDLESDIKGIKTEVVPDSINEKNKLLSINNIR